jgi:hypothetical protein
VLWTELKILIRDTGRIWWRLLPVIMGVYLLGWLGNELILRIAVTAGDVSPWLALVLFALSFVCTLTAAIVILTLAGRELGIRQLLPEDEREADDRETSLTPLLLVTLLPFLAMYAAFGQVTEAANRLVIQQQVRYGPISHEQTVLGALYDLATQHLGWLLARGSPRERARQHRYRRQHGFRAGGVDFRASICCYGLAGIAGLARRGKEQFAILDDRDGCTGDVTATYQNRVDATSIVISHEDVEA